MMVSRWNSEWRLLAGPVLEDRPAMAEVVRPGPACISRRGGRPGRSQRPRYWPPQVGALEVGLADLFGGLDVLVVVIVGVETGAASLAGDRAAHQAATRRTKVEARATQVGIMQVGTWPVDFGQPAPRRSAPMKLASCIREPVKSALRRSASWKSGTVSTISSRSQSRRSAPPKRA